MIRKRLITAGIILVLLFPLWMFIAWCLATKKKLVTAIIDKTVLTPDGQEHISLTWVLDHEKYSKNKNDLYDVKSDYFGFFPRKNEQYRIKGLERFTNEQLEQLSKDADAVYITDAYGVYKNEWYVKKNVEERSPMIYGGMSSQDVQLLLDMKNKHKLILAEFNCIGSPTEDRVREKFEDAFGMKWTDWIGRYFESFDTSVNQELPHWLINNYKREHNGKWPFKKGGVALVSNSDHVIILENGEDLSLDMPKILTSEFGIEHYGLPKELYYPFWFDIVTTDTTLNKVISHFDIGITEAGKSKLHEYNIPLTFPAVQMHKGTDYEFYYFAADFSDNPISINSSYFKGIEYLNFFFYNKLDRADRKRFFWKYYRPLVTTILNEYYTRIK